MVDNGFSDTTQFEAEFERRLSAFDNAVSKIEDVLSNLHKVSHSEMTEPLSTLDKARFDLVGAYAMNSLFWMYLNVNGINPKEHSIKQELDRIRNYESRAKEIQDRDKAPRLNVDASKRFVRNALWDAAQKGLGQSSSATKRKPTEETSGTSSPSSVDLNSSRVEEETPDDARKRKKQHKDKRSKR